MKLEKLFEKQKLLMLIEQADHETLKAQTKVLLDAYYEREQLIQTLFAKQLGINIDS
jgi:hypothetical protein